ncbi:MAG: PIG-L family deacetylase, partial [Acidobacteriota bacterium]
MLHLLFKRPAGGRMKVLCLGAHCDDIEIGCGGTVLRLVEENPGLEILWKVFSSNKVRKKEAEKSAALFAGNKTKLKCMVGNYRDGFFPYLGMQIKEDFEALKAQFSPDLIMTHHTDDLHQDHRLISELTWNTFRDHLILEYEVPKYDG